MKIKEIADNIKKLVLKEFNKRDNRETDKLSIIGDDYRNRLYIAQRLEELKLIIYPYFKQCKYCEEEFNKDNIHLRGDKIICCKKQECFDAWVLEEFGEEGLKLKNKLNKAVSCGISSKGMHVTYKDGKEEWI